MRSGTTFSVAFATVLFVIVGVPGVDGQTTPPAKPQSTAQTRPQTTPPAKPQTSTPAQKLAAADSTFLKHAAEDGMAEVELAEVAQSKSSNADVKALASTIKEDHTKANAELKTLAASKNVTLPDAPDKQHAATKDRFSKMDGKSFDRSYVNAMVTDHRKAIADFTSRTKSGDPDVRAFAERTLPALKDHLARAEALQKTVK